MTPYETLRTMVAERLRQLLDAHMIDGRDLDLDDVDVLDEADLVDVLVENRADVAAWLEQLATTKGEQA